MNVGRYSLSNFNVNWILKEKIGMSKCIGRGNMTHITDLRNSDILFPFVEFVISMQQ